MPTLRLSLTYDQDDARVEAVQIVDARPPKGERAPKAGTDAYWLEMRAPKRRVFRRRLPDPGIGREVFGEDGGIGRVAGEARRAILVDLPWWGPQSELVFHSGDLRAAVQAPWREVKRVAGAALEAQVSPQVAAAFPTVPLDFGANAEDALTLVFLAEGFTAAELPAYAAAVDGFLAKLAATAPFDGLLGALSAVRVDCVSADSGIDDPDNGVSRNTLFAGRFGHDALRRLIEVDQGKARNVARAAADGRRTIAAVAVANTTEYGGSGGEVAVFSLHAQSADIALHEMGHSLFGLADEYSDAGGSGAPSEPNVTAKPASGAAWGASDRARLKWRDFLSAGVALPTASNPDCTRPMSGALPGGVGAFEGGKYRHCGVWRPTADCKMRTLTADFCPVCQAVIADKLRQFIPA